MFTAELKGGPRDGEIRAMQGEPDKTPVIAIIGIDHSKSAQAIGSDTVVTFQDYYLRTSSRMLDNGSLVEVYAWDKENYVGP